MAVVAVTADNTRVAVGTIATDTGTWGNIGGGGGVSDEPDIWYQSATAQSRKVSTTTIGRSYTHGSGTDMTAAGRTVWLAKVQATNPAALQTRSTPALQVRIGSSSSATYDFDVAGSDNYPARGGFLLVPIDPNVSGYRDATNGSGHSLTAILYWGVIGDFTAGSKSENLVIDAIDVGRGLVMTGGDGADTDGTFADFLAHDEGTAANRYGYIYSEGPVCFTNGRLAIGENSSGTATACGFTDADKSVVWNNGYFPTGWAQLRINLGISTTICTVTDCTFISAGEDNNSLGLGYSTTEDTRLQVIFASSTGSATWTRVKMQNLSVLTLTSAVSLQACVFDVETMTQASADVEGCTISTTSAASTAMLSDPTFAASTDLNTTDFVQAGAGHAIEHDTAGSYTYTSIGFSGYGTDGSTSAAVRNTITPTTVDSYSETNQDATQALGNGTTTAVGQEFAASAGVLNATRWDLSKTGTPTGSLVAELYATDGASPAEPTGSVLATSEALDVSTLTGTLTVTQIDFGDQFTLSAATSYFIVLRYAGGDGSNHVNVGVDTSSPGHGGNFATEAAATWTGISGTDGCFYVYRDGGVVINVEGGDNPTYTNATTGASTVIYNTVTLSITVLDQANAAIQNAQVAIYPDGDPTTELMNEDTLASGIASEPYDYPGSEVDIMWRVRKSETTDNPRYFPLSGTGTITAGGFTLTVNLEENTFI